MKHLLLLFALLFIPVPAHAHFTDAEVESIREGLFRAMNKTAVAFEQPFSIMALSVNTGDAASLNIGWHELMKTDGAWQSQARALSYLLNIHPTLHPTACGANRAACVASAKAEVVQAITALTAAKAEMSGCFVSGSTANFRNQCSAAGGLLQEAIDALEDNFDETLSYTDWRSSWYPRVAGPHGHFDEMVFQSISAILTATAGLDLIRQAWYWPGTGDAVWTDQGTTNISCTVENADQACAWGRLVQRMGLVTPRIHQPLFAWALIPWPGTNEVTGSAGYRLRNSISALELYAHAFEISLAHGSASQMRRHEISGLPYQYDNFATDSFTALMYAMTTRPNAKPLFFEGWNAITVNAWFHSDNAAALAFEFPDNATLLQLRAEKNPLNDPDGPPVTIAR